MYKLPENLDSKYRFVTLASKRAEQLQSGARSRVELENRKATVVAQAEVAEELVNLYQPEDEHAVDMTDDEEEE